MTCPLLFQAITVTDCCFAAAWTKRSTCPAGKLCILYPARYTVTFQTNTDWIRVHTEVVSYLLTQFLKRARRVTAQA
jgi:hypothetical protein